MWNVNGRRKNFYFVKPIFMLSGSLRYVCQNISRFVGSSCFLLKLFLIIITKIDEPKILLMHRTLQVLWEGGLDMRLKWTKVRPSLISFLQAINDEFFLFPLWPQTSSNVNSIHLQVLYCCDYAGCGLWCEVSPLIRDCEREHDSDKRVYRTRNPGIHRTRVDPQAMLRQAAGLVDPPPLPVPHPLR